MNHSFNLPVQVHSDRCDQNLAVIGPGFVDLRLLEEFDRFDKVTVRKAREYEH